MALEETKIIYHIDDEDTPYLVKLPVPPDRVTLGDFKNVLNRPNYKFFFKSMDDDFGVVKEEISDDNAKLPCVGGRVVSWLVTAEGSSLSDSTSQCTDTMSQRSELRLPLERTVGIGDSRPPSFHATALDHRDLGDTCTETESVISSRKDLHSHVHRLLKHRDKHFHDDHGGQMMPQGDQKLAEKLLQIKSKIFYMDVRNRRGRFIKITELGTAQGKNSILLAISTVAEFRDHLTSFSELDASLGPPNPDNLPEVEKLKSEVMVKDNRRYYLDLKENSRGRFLRVSQTIARGGPRSQIVIPAQGIIKFRDALTDLLEEFGTDDAEMNFHEIQQIEERGQISDKNVDDDRRGIGIHIYECLSKIMNKFIIHFPPLLLMFIIFVSYFTYMIVLCIYTIENILEKVWYIIILQPLTFLLLWSLYKTTSTESGPIPKEFSVYAADAEILGKDNVSDEQKQILENFGKDLPIECRSINGTYRYCKTCNIIKPDRTYHCEICGRCILKKDHHCYWVNNCISHINYKFFLLLNAYAVLYASYLATTSMKYFIKVWTNTYSSFEKVAVISLFFGSIIFTIVLLIFFCFHIYLVSTNRTTIEYVYPPYFQTGQDKYYFNLGCYNNFLEIFGEDIRKWLLPVHSSFGNGIYFKHKTSDEVNEILLEESSF